MDITQFAFAVANLLCLLLMPFMFTRLAFKYVNSMRSKKALICDK